MRTLPTLVLIACAGFSLSACSSVFGTDARDIAVKTIPAGARCEFDDQGYMLGSVDATPGTASVETSDHEVQLVCRLAGHPNVEMMVGNQTSVSLTFEPGLIPNPAPTQPVTSAPIGAPGQ